MNSLHTYYGVEKDESNMKLDLGMQVNYDQFASTRIHRHFNDENLDNDIIGMMWEPELDFVDDPECYNECRNQNGPMRFMCGVCLGQFRTR